jgi:hypothetical protein
MPQITAKIGIRGFYLLNASLRRLGLREVPELPQPPSTPSLEDIVRLAFSVLDPDLFPKPSWMLNVDAKDVDHAIRLVVKHRDTVQSYKPIPGWHNAPQCDCGLFLITAHT